MSETPIPAVQRAYADVRHRWKPDHGNDPERCLTCGLQEPALCHESRYPWTTTLAVMLATIAGVVAALAALYVIDSRASNRATTKTEVAVQTQTQLCTLTAEIPGLDARLYEKAHGCKITAPLPVNATKLPTSDPSAIVSLTPGVSVSQNPVESPNGVIVPAGSQPATPGAPAQPPHVVTVVTTKPGTTTKVTTRITVPPTTAATPTPIACVLGVCVG